MKGAELSTCRNYRYALWRVWEPEKPYVLFIGLNPSTADETEDDPTIRRCINFAKSWGYGGIYMANLFAFRTSKPRELWLADDPVGHDNDRWLLALSEKAELTIAAWGNGGSHQGRSRVLRSQIPGLHCLVMNNGGEPRHPLYVPGDTMPFLMP